MSTGEAHPDAPALRGGLYGLLAAALFGASAPFSKLLLPHVGPLTLAALLYLGAALPLWLARWFGDAPAVEAPLRRSDLPPLSAIVLLGGVVGPVCLMLGLQRVSGVSGSLLLNLEGPLTIAIAITVFREHLSPRELGAAALIVSGAGVLSLAPGPVRGHWTGALLVACACAAWAMDNNLTQRLSTKDPRAIVRVKALGAGVCNLALAFGVGESLPRWPVCLAALVLGALSYGASILLDVYALRLLGAAREAAFFATAPFIGALLAVPLLGEGLGPAALGAMAVMALGVVLLLRARHGHLHAHEALAHEHLHVHDAHHQHAHPPGTPEGEPHAHWHEHAPTVHDHPHVADLHHRHPHRAPQLRE